MDDKYKEIIRNDISPKVRNGDLTLFLGAGISIDTPAINDLGIPSTPELVRRICIEAGYDEETASTADLPTAFGVGEDEIEEFENFLISHFTTMAPSLWQVKIFQHWWRAIFTTNIDTIPKAAIEACRQQSKDFPSYTEFNYNDREPIQSLPTSPPLVYLHGTVSRPQDGFVFDNVSYAEHSVNQSDWLVKSALHISHGNCLFVGSKFNESDIDTALRRRQAWDQDEQLLTNWIVLRSFSPLEESAYRKRGITPIRAEAEEFFNYLFSQLPSPLSKHKFIKKKAPFLSDNTDNKSLAWFADNMSSVSQEIEKVKNKNAPFSLFYNGALPDWFYIYNDVPAKFSARKGLIESIIDFENSDRRAAIFPILGPLAAGKTTLAMQVLSEIAETHNNIYSFTGLDGIDIEATWRVLKDLKGLVVIFIDAASTYFYAVNEIVQRVLDNPVSCRVCFLLEERTIYYERNKRHFNKIPGELISNIRVGNLDREDADILYRRTVDLGIVFEKLDGLEREQAITQIVDADTGYNGDLLATLYDLSSRRSYTEKLSEEFSEIDNELAKKVYETISLVTASRLKLPISYLCEIYSMSTEAIMKLTKSHLTEKVTYHGSSLTITARHHSIAEYHISSSFAKASLQETVIELMKCVSKKFTVDDIRRHPLSYKIYSKVLSYHHLTETLFSERVDYHYIHSIYSECQKYFAEDGLFWLQYGRFLERDGNIDEALHCFRKGLGLHESFQLRHAIGQLLLKKYRTDQEPIEEDFTEGVDALRNEIIVRGAIDAYPYTALGNELIRTYRSGRKKAECAAILKEIINQGMGQHREDDYFSKMVTRYFKIIKEADID